MCGIVGIVGKKNRQKMSASELFDMCNMQKHRGPDDEGGVAIDCLSGKINKISKGEIADCKALFGFKRLSIQDVSIKGHQPMLNKEANVSIIFNGEIYNFKELREVLIKKGHILESGTDTEVILHMYLEYGIDETLNQLNGMFAFSIVDLRINKLFLARDRFGIKPLYIANTSDAVLFSSEMKSFIPYHGFSVDFNENALEEYLLFKSLLKDTLMKDIEQVEPGSMLVFDLDGNEIKKSKFFDIEEYHRTDTKDSFEDLKEQFWEMYHDVVRRQTISDVKVGCQLSGGIDSSILAMTVAKEHGLYDTVSCKVNCSDQVDAPYIDIVNERLKANSHIGNMDENYFIEHLIDTVWHFENVLSHTPSVGMFQISEIANQSGLKVLLSGEGADELFGGYKCFTNMAFADSKPSEEDIVSAIVFRDGKSETAELQKILPSIKPDKYYEKRIELLNHFTGSVFDRQVKYELTTQLGELLERQDKMAMSHSIENRVPFLDNEMARFAWKVPEKYLMDYESKEGKFILKKIVADILGNDFAFRKKVGFFIPGNMFMSSNMSFINNVLSGARKRGIIKCDVLDDWAQNKLNTMGGLNHFDSAVFLKMFTFEIWCQLYLDGLSVEECKACNIK